MNVRVLQATGKAITNVVDFEKSAEQHRTSVTSGVDPELDRIKQTYDGMDSLLNKARSDLINNVPEWATQYIQYCMCFPQLGFLTVVILDLDTGKGKFDGEGLNGDVWEKKFNTENMCYYKNNYMRDMDRHFGDMYSTICGKFFAMIG